MALKIRSRIWIEGARGTFLGNGRIQLLEKIHETGSIRDAAKSLRMSYRKAWSMLESMNSQASGPYIVPSIGGAGGGGTEVTRAGLRAISDFRKINEKCIKLLDREMKKSRF